MLSMISQSDSEKARDILRSWIYFDLFKTTPFSDKATTPLLAFCEIASDKMSYQDGERDMILMKHIFGIETADGSKRTLHSTYVGIGDPLGAGHTIMSQTVGLTTVIGVDLVLQGKVERRGIIMPTTKDIYEPTLARL